MYSGRCLARVDPKDLLFDGIMQLAGDAVAFGQRCCFACLLQSLLAHLGHQPLVGAIVSHTLLDLQRTLEQRTEWEAPREQWRGSAFIPG